MEYGKPGQQMPWFWGDDLEKAQALAREHNSRQGISPKDADVIIAGMMQRGRLA
ncbi:MAG: hypothetical protein IIA67_08140 [Planctomycetes bacterium]|nr:hypothetical protein [Planctomycetota bacterium]